MEEDRPDRRAGQRAGRALRRGRHQEVHGAQAAEIDKQKALNEQQVAKTEAETKKIKAQGEADANAVLNESLTDNVLKQHYIDALSNADQLVVVPDGADTLVQTK